MEEAYFIALGELIRNKRRLKNYTQEYMAQMLGISQNGYYKIEAGKSKYSVYRLLLILKVLEISPYELFDEDIFIDYSL